MLSVRIAKLLIIPRVIPNAFCFPPVADDESITGSSGQMQGAKIVIKPEIKENNKRINIVKNFTP